MIESQQEFFIQSTMTSLTNVPHKNIYRGRLSCALTLILNLASGNRKSCKTACDEIILFNKNTEIKEKKGISKAGRQANSLNLKSTLFKFFSSVYANFL